MKTSIAILVLVLVFAAGSLFADSPLAFTSEATAISNGTAGEITVGQDVVLTLSPFCFTLNGDYGWAFPADTHVFDLAYIVAFNKALGPFTLGAALNGDQSFPVDGEASGFWLNYATASADFLYKIIGCDTDFRFGLKPDYKLMQAFEISCYVKPAFGEVRIGWLYMDPQAVTDDVGYDKAPLAQAGNSLFAKVKVSY